MHTIPTISASYISYYTYVYYPPYHILYHSPGFLQDDFLAFLAEECVRQNDTDLTRQRGRCVVYSVYAMRSTYHMMRISRNFI